MILASLIAPFLGATFVSLIGDKHSRVRNLLADVVVVAEFALLLTALLSNFKSFMDGGSIALDTAEICGMELHFKMDGFRGLYALVAAFMWMMTVVFSNEYGQHHKRMNRYYIFMLMTLGATEGVFLSSNLFTTFIFFEIMSFTSYTWVAQEETEDALKAAGTYLAVAVIGGMVMLMGLFMIYHEVGSLEFDVLFTGINHLQPGAVMYAAGACLLFGFGAKAGAFPLHIWLPKAHPVAPAPASALLSGVLTKTGIFGIIVVSTSIFSENAVWGQLILVLGVVTMFGGALLAVFSVDLKRTLACSSMSQIGFILVGIGMVNLLGEENSLAVHGAFLHMVNHSLIKLVLFMAAGVVFMNLHALDLNTIRGFGRKKPLLMLIFLTGALSIAGIPLFSGYISKTLLHESILEYGSDGFVKAIEYIFLFSGGLTLAYMTKLFVCIFVEKNSDEKLQKKYDANRKYMNPVTTMVLMVSAIALFLWGIIPGVMDKAAELSQGFMRLEEYGEEVNYFTLENLKGALITLIVGSIVYFGIIRTLLMKERSYVNRWPKWLDMENLLYRPLVLMLLPFIGGVVCRAMDSLVDGLVVVLRKTIYKDAALPSVRTEGDYMTEKAGKLVSALSRNKDKDYEHIFAMKKLEHDENVRIITRSLSFGLVLFGLGFMLTLAYLLLW